MLRRLDSAGADFEAQLRELTAGDDDDTAAVAEQVAQILRAVRERGDAALLEYTATFDGYAVTDAAALELPPARLHDALARLAATTRDALETAAQRLRDYHMHQRAESWSFHDADGSELGQRVTPIERVGVYVPGGKAAYPSSVLMNVIPARVAGVDEIVMVVPAPGGTLSEAVLAAACIGGVDRVFTIGGAQAVGALAWGTATVPRVDKIVGPGNRYVAAAKRQVFGRVGIDMIAGPSEVLVIADGSAPAEWLAMDLFSQAEHDEMARALLLCPDPAYLDRIESVMRDVLPSLGRGDIVRAALQGRGALIQVRDLTQATEISNRLAPEHLELAVADADALLPLIRHAGAIFVGAYTPEAVGDYCAGPNHVLPTGGTARFSSPLGVYDFQKRSSLIRCSAAGAQRLGEIAGVLADAEGLDAHARSARLRLDPAECP